MPSKEQIKEAVETLLSQLVLSENEVQNLFHPSLSRPNASAAGRGRARWSS
jgi:hypothetical protein